MFSTDISGNLSVDELSIEAERVREVFNGEVEGFFFNGKPIETYVEVYPLKPIGDDDHLLIGSTGIGNFRDYVEPEYWEGYKKREREYRNKGRKPNKIGLIGRNWALLFPYHKTALILEDYIFDTDHPDKLKDLENLGYTIARQRKKNYSTILGNENKVELIKSLRNPALSTSAIDPRTIEILEKLTSNLPTGNPTYTFGIFDPGFFWSGDEEAYGPSPEDVEKRINPVKKLVEIPAKWAINGGLEKLAKKLPLTRAIGLTSKVKIDGDTYHIPMIDFAEGVSNLPKGDLDKVNIPGMFVLSGKSGHFYGFELLEEKELESFLDKSKRLFSIDQHWPDLQIRQGFSMLRLTPSRRKLFQPCFRELYTPDKAGNDDKSNTHQDSALLVA
ncbi:hypothetical protein CMI46_01715 [Candidatus Pacearchaeota archaeon]|nr:hypothetical protein [Candidatus Pacearchaeota archaeon]|tara:strand:- start:6567 stop:7730 length:1164 start_codon:yes stop_codon:yes gene_type:complete